MSLRHRRLASVAFLLVWSVLGCEGKPGPEPLELVEVDLPHQRTGSGVLVGIGFEPENPSDASALHAARLRIFWDGAPEPAVDVPLDMFFGSGLGDAPVRAVPFVMDEGRWLNRLRMPFEEGMRIELEGAAGRLRVAVEEDSSPGEGRLHAHYAREAPTTPGENFTWLSREGAGTLVGTVLAIQPHSSDTKRWWEGDLHSYVDGLATPSMHGTGHEDDHLGGWSNMFLSNPFSLPLHGESKADILDRNGQINANVTLYRFWPGIEFLSSILHGVEHGNENGVVATYEGVSFFYAHDAQSLVESDFLDLSSEVSRLAHGYTVEGESAEQLTSELEGRDSRMSVEGWVASHEGEASFVLQPDPAQDGCLLRRRFDQAVARQRAMVAVDGQPVGPWYTAEGNTSRRWAERDIFLPRELLSSASPSVTVSLSPDGDAPWSAAWYRLLCIVPRDWPRRACGVLLDQNAVAVIPHGTSRGCQVSSPVTAARARAGAPSENVRRVEPARAVVTAQEACSVTVGVALTGG